MRVCLETERLTLRCITTEDEDRLFELNSDPEVMRFINGGQPSPRSEIQDRVLPYLLSFYAKPGGFGYWAAELTATGEFLGWFHFRAPPSGESGDIELGYRLRRAAWGQGYATEGSRALIRKGFTELGVQRVIAETMAVNTGSRRVMEKSGLTFVRTIVPGFAEGIEGAELGDVEYAITRAAWTAAGGPLP